MSEKQMGIEDIGNIVNTFLNVTNMNANEEGMFEAEIAAFAELFLSFPAFILHLCQHFIFA